LAVYHIAYREYKRVPSAKEMDDRLAMLNGALVAAPFAQGGIAGRYCGNPKDGFHARALINVLSGPVRS